AIQCVLQDRVVSYRHVNRYVDHHDFLLADLVRGWLSETRGLPSRDQMSASGPKRTCASALHMSAFGGKADVSWSVAKRAVGSVGLLQSVGPALPESRVDRPGCRHRKRRSSANAHGGKTSRRWSPNCESRRKKNSPRQSRRILHGPPKN